MSVDATPANDVLEGCNALLFPGKQLPFAISMGGQLTPQRLAPDARSSLTIHACAVPALQVAITKFLKLHTITSCGSQPLIPSTQMAEEYAAIEHKEGVERECCPILSADAAVAPF